MGVDPVSPYNMNTLTPAYLRVPAACAYSGIKRSSLYKLLSKKLIKSHNVGASRLIDRASIDAYISNLPS